MTLGLHSRDQHVRLRCVCMRNAALAVIRYMATDGYNQLGDMTPDGGLINGNTYNRWNYSVGPPCHSHSEAMLKSSCMPGLQCEAC